MIPVLFKVGPLPIYSFGVFLTLGIVLGTFVSWRKAREYHLADEKYFDLVFSALLGGIVTGRIWYVVTHFTDFGWNVLKWLWFTQYLGLSFVGAAIGALLAIIVVARHYNQDVFKTLDLLSIGAALGLGISWFGAFLDGFPVGIRLEKLGLTLPGREGVYFPVHVVAIVGYMALYSLLAFYESRYRTLEWYRAGKSSAKPGFLFAFFLIFMGIIQLVTVRLTFSATLIWGLPLESWLGLATTFVGIFILYSRSGRKLKNDLRNLKIGRTRG